MLLRRGVEDVEPEEYIHPRLLVRVRRRRPRHRMSENDTAEGRMRTPSAMWRLSTADLSMDEPDRDGQTNLHALPCAFTPEPILLSMHFIWILMTGPIRAEDKKQTDQG